MNLYTILIDAASAGLFLQNNNGSFLPGHNGPWNNPDTPVRTTAHWVMMFLKAFELTGDDRFRKAAVDGCNFLLGPEARPYRYTFYCRKAGSGKNRCNGLIGQAWAVEPLLKAGAVLNEEAYLHTAIEVLQYHPYDEKRGGWLMVDIDGQILNYCHTVNQQVWFGMMAQQAGFYDTHLRDISLDFFEHLSAHIEFLEPGLIKHVYYPGATRQQCVRASLYRTLQSIANPKKSEQQKASLFELSEGYQPFLLYGLSAAFSQMDPPPFFMQKWVRFWQPAISYTLQRGMSTTLSKNRYAWQYNPIGIEIAFILQVFGTKMKFDESVLVTPKDWLQEQLSRHYDTQRSLLSLNTQDAIILAARIYEAVRLDNYDLSINGGDA